MGEEDSFSKSFKMGCGAALGIAAALGLLVGGCVTLVLSYRMAEFKREGDRLMSVADTIEAKLETLSVGDKVLVRADETALRPSPEAKIGQIVWVLKKGQTAKILEIRRSETFYIRVRDSGGHEGWVRVMDLEGFPSSFNKPTRP